MTGIYSNVGWQIEIEPFHVPEIWKAPSWNGGGFGALLIQVEFWGKDNSVQDRGSYDKDPRYVRLFGWGQYLSSDQVDCLDTEDGSNLLAVTRHSSSGKLEFTPHPRSSGCKAKLEKGVSCLFLPWSIPVLQKQTASIFCKSCMSSFLCPCDTALQYAPADCNNMVCDTTMQRIVYNTQWERCTDDKSGSSVIPRTFARSAI